MIFLCKLYIYYFHKFVCLFGVLCPIFLPANNFDISVRSGTFALDNVNLISYLDNMLRNKRF